MSVDTRSILGKVGVALVLSSLYAFPACAQTNYSKTVELPALRISLTQLQDVLNKAFSLMSTATGSARLWREYRS